MKQLEESKNEISKLKIEQTNVERECASAKGLVVKLNKKIQDMKSQLDSSKAEVIKANAEKDLLIKSSESSASAEKEAQELKKKLESAMAEKVILENRMEHLKIILRNNKSKSNETQQKLQDALQAEKEARSKVQQEKESFEARLKEIDSSISATKNTSEENQVVNQLDSAQVNNMEVSDESTTKKTSKPISSEVEATTIPAPQIPTVPKEGFKFIASKVSGDNVDNTLTPVNRNGALTEQTSSETNMPITETDKSNNTSEVSEKSSSNILTPVPTKKVDTTENVAKANSSQTSKETSLKERLLEKKRKMAESIAAQKLALQSSVTNTPKTDIQQDSIDTVLDTKNKSNMDPKAPVPASSNATTTDVVDDKKHTESDRDSNGDLRSTEEEENVDKVEEETKEESKEENDQEHPNKPSKTVLGSSLNPAAAPFKLFGSGSSAPVFGQGTSASLLGSSSTGTTSATRGGAFLNLKPPGSGPAVPLTFGSSPNITIPTPSKDPLPVESQPFAAFKGGSFPFGAPTTSQPQATSLFDSSSNTGKKRSLETDDTQEAENASTKLARVEEEKSEEKEEEEKVEEINETHEESIEEADEDDLEE